MTEFEIEFKKLQDEQRDLMHEIKRYGDSAEFWNIKKRELEVKNAEKRKQINELRVSDQLKTEFTDSQGRKHKVVTTFVDYEDMFTGKFGYYESFHFSMFPNHNSDDDKVWDRCSERKDRQDMHDKACLKMKQEFP
jgi:hypothetical protein